MTPAPLRDWRRPALGAVPLSPYPANSIVRGLLVATGTGIPDHLLERIFDPFVTTKEVGKGTGLGLSTARSIARAHGGWLDVETHEGYGSTFRILLPAISASGIAQRDVA